MKMHAALDTSATTTAIYVVSSQSGKIVFEANVPTDPDAIYKTLEPYAAKLQLVGLASPRT